MEPANMFLPNESSGRAMKVLGNVSGPQAYRKDWDTFRDAAVHPWVLSVYTFLSKLYLTQSRQNGVSLQRHIF